MFRLDKISCKASTVTSLVTGNSFLAGNEELQDDCKWFLMFGKNWS